MTTWEVRSPCTALRKTAKGNSKGIRFLDEHYAAEHLLPIEDTLDDLDEAGIEINEKELDDLVAVCKRNGGALG